MSGNEQEKGATDQSSPYISLVSPHNKTSPEEPALEAPVSPGLEDIDVMALKANINDEIVTKKLVSSIDVRKPRHLEWFRVRDGDEWTYASYILHDPQDGEIYLIAPQIREVVEKDMIYVNLYTAISDLDHIFLLPVKEKSLKNTWINSLFTAVQQARIRWTRIRSNQERGTYDILQAQGGFKDPVWPETFTIVKNNQLIDAPVTMSLLVTLAFKEKFINRPDHPMVNKILGIKEAGHGIDI